MLSNTTIIIIVLLTLIILFLTIYSLMYVKKIDNTIHNELTLKQIYNIFYHVNNNLCNSNFNIDNLSYNLLLSIKQKMITWYSVEEIILHEIERNKKEINVTFTARLKTGEYTKTKWTFDPYKEIVYNIDNIYDGSK